MLDKRWFCSDSNAEDHTCLGW